MTRKHPNCAHSLGHEPLGRLDFRFRGGQETINRQKFGVSTAFGAGGGAGSQTPLAP